MDLFKGVEALGVCVKPDSPNTRFVTWLRSKATIINSRLFEISENRNGKLGAPGISPQLVSRAGLAFDIDGWFLGFEEEFSHTTDAKAVIRRFRSSGNLNGILMNDILILLCISSFIHYIPAQGF